MGSWALLGAIILSGALHAQDRDLTLYSPITHQPFTVLVPQVAHPGDELDQLSDLGADDDGCRYDAGLDEYSHYIVTCPFTYFTAMTGEWDQHSGRFLAALPADMSDWVRSQFAAEWKIGFSASIAAARVRAQQGGGAPPDPATYTIPQTDIPIETRYRLALLCYEHRGVAPSVLAKVALTGAWAIRTRMVAPFHDPVIEGAYQEVDDLLMRRKGGHEAAHPDVDDYASILATPGLTEGAYLVAGLGELALDLRMGDAKACSDLLSRLTRRVGRLDHTGVLPGVMRERTHAFAIHQGFLQLAADNFVRAIAADEFARPRLPDVVFEVAECLRRTGRLGDALDWYRCLVAMPEARPQELERLRRARTPPGPDAPFPLQEAWLAQDAIDRVQSAAGDLPKDDHGRDGALIAAIDTGGLGTPGYRDPAWKPRTGESLGSCTLMLSLIGQAILDFHLYLGSWPTTLDDLWLQDILRDRNRVNRFCCPIDGRPLVYHRPTGDLRPGSILISTSAALPTPSGPRYLLLTANLSTVWSSEPPAAPVPTPPHDHTGAAHASPPHP